MTTGADPTPETSFILNIHQEIEKAQLMPIIGELYCMSHCYRFIQNHSDVFAIGRCFGLYSAVEAVK
jgi:hypothetical protein